MRRPKKKNVKDYLNCDSFCPWCESENITAEHKIETDISSAWQDVSCNACGAEWQDQFKLVAISWRKKNGERLYSDEVFKEN